MKGTETSYFGTSGDWLLRRLGEPLFGRKRAGGRRGRVKALDDLARAGLPLQGKVMLTEEAHEVYLEVSGILESVKVAPWKEKDPRQMASEIRSRYGSVSMEASLKQEICRASIELGAPIVTVLPEHWEISSIYTAWSIVEETPIETPRVGDPSRGQKVTLHDVEPSGGEGPERRGTIHITLETGAALGARPRIVWGLEGSIWYVLSTELAEDEKSVQGWFS